MFKKTMTVQLLIGCILIISACKHSYEMPNTWGSYIGSLTVAHGDYIYHADYDHGIYKVNMHTGESQKFLQTEGSARSLNIIKDRLYYTESVGDFVSVYSIGLDGTDLRTECSSSTWYILNMIIHDNVIYFYDFIKTDDQYYQNIYRVNLDGTDKTPLTEAYAHLSICGIYKGRLYYRVKNGGNLKMRQTTTRGSPNKSGHGKEPDERAGAVRT